MLSPDILINVTSHTPIGDESDELELSKLEKILTFLKKYLTFKLLVLLVICSDLLFALYCVVIEPNNPKHIVSVILSCLTLWEKKLIVDVYTTCILLVHEPYSWQHVMLFWSVGRIIGIVPCACLQKFHTCWVIASEPVEDVIGMFYSPSLIWMLSHCRK